MTDLPPPPPASPAPQNLAVLKAVTAGLGLLLVGGVALLCVLLVTRGDDASSGASVASATPTLLTLAAGERFVSASAAGTGVLITVATPSGHRLVVIGADGMVTTVAEVRSAP